MKTVWDHDTTFSKKALILYLKFYVFITSCHRLEMKVKLLKKQQLPWGRWACELCCVFGITLTSVDSIHQSMLVLQSGCWWISQLPWGRMWEDSTRNTNNHPHSHEDKHVDHLEMPIGLMCMALDCRRSLKRSNTGRPWVESVPQAIFVYL